jgi:branched-chain amino acid transport system ATP-binding protein
MGWSKWSSAVDDLEFSWARRGVQGDSCPPVLEVKNLSVKVGIRRVLDDINLAVYEDDVVYVTGTNGSGKSTLLNAIAGIDPGRVQSGSILLIGKDITYSPPHLRARLGLSYCRQRDNVFADMTVEENLQLALGVDGYARFRKRYPSSAAALPPSKRVSLCSGGQKQRLAWAMAELRERKLLLADEPEAGLSAEFSLPSRGTFLIVSHLVRQ